GLLLPVLLHEGYSRKFSLGLTTTSGSRGLVFPPSLPVIIYGYVATVDITKLYIAGIVPGLLGIVVIAAWCIRSGILAQVPKTPFDPKAALKAIWKALPEVLLPVWLVAAILTGVLKVPEAAALTALYVLIVEVFICRDIHPIKDLPKITKESMVLCGAVLVILGASLGLTNYLVDERIPQAIMETISSAIQSKWVFLLALNIFLLVVGCMMDIFSAIVVVVPLITPLAIQFGIHPIHLAIIFLFNLELGYSTPPVGMNLFIASFRFRQPIIRLYRAALPFVLLGLVTLGVVTYVEPLSTFTLPKETRAVQSGQVVQPKSSSEKGKSPLPQKGKATMDGLCDPNQPNDPDCGEVDIEEDP
ncbi:MAG: TRAP transporter large permease, partial [Pseudomonadota bacterium]